MTRITYTGDGSTSEFHFNFPFFQTGDIRVTVNGETAAAHTINAVSAGGGADIPFTGGSIVFAVAPEAGSAIVIRREIMLNRLIDYQPAARILPQNLNKDFNFTIENIRDLRDALNELAGLEHLDIESITAQIENALKRLENIGDITDLATRDELNEIANSINKILGEFIDAVETDIFELQSSQTEIRSDLSDAKHELPVINSRIDDLEDQLDDLADLDMNELRRIVKNLSDMDYVVEKATGITGANFINGWYRKYKSGWVEQGGRITAANANNIITFPIPLSDIPHSIGFSQQGSASASIGRIIASPQTNTNMTITGIAASTVPITWEVKGFSA